MSAKADSAQSRCHAGVRQLYIVEQLLGMSLLLAVLPVIGLFRHDTIDRRLFVWDSV